MAIEIINVFQTRTVWEAITKLPAPPSFLRDTFFPRRETVPNEIIDFDFKRGKRVVALPIDENDPDGQVLERPGYQTLTFQMPLYAPVRPLNVTEIKAARFMGENIFSTATAAERALSYLAIDILELEASLALAEEIQVLQLLTTGAVTLNRNVDSGTSPNVQTLSYGTPQIVIPGTTSGYGPLWSTTATATPFADLDKFSRFITQKSLTRPNIIISDSDTLNYFLAIAGADKLFWPEKLNIGNIDVKQISDQVTYAGTLRKPAVDWYIYDNFYINTLGTEVPMLNSGWLIMGNTQTMGKIAYGPVTQLEGEGESLSFKTYMAPRVPMVWGDRGKGQRKLKLSTRPLPIPDDFLVWGLMKTLG